jgi:hypothetical protein
LSEVDETSILKLGLPDLLHLFAQLVTVSTGRRPIGSCARLSGLSRSDFVRWPEAEIHSGDASRPVIGSLRVARPSLLFRANMLA